MVTIFRIVEASPGSARDVMGKTPRCFGPLAAMGRLGSVTDDRGFVRLEPSMCVPEIPRDGQGRSLASLAEPRVLSFIDETDAPAYQIEFSHLDAEQIARRRRELANVLKDIPSFLREHARHVAERTFDLFIELGLQADVVAAYEAMSARGPVEEVFVRETFERLAAGGKARVATDARGKDLDHSHAQVVESEHAASLPSPVEVSPPNERTNEDLGFGCVLEVDDVDEIMPEAFEVTRSRRAVCVGTKRYFVLWSKAATRFVKMRSTKLPGRRAARLMGDDEVIPCTTIEAKALMPTLSFDSESSVRFLEWLLESIAQQKPRSGDRDERTLEGRIALDQAGIGLDEFLPRTAFGGWDAYTFDSRHRILIDSIHHGLGVAKDVACAFVQQKIAERWNELHSSPELIAAHERNEQRRAQQPTFRQTVSFGPVGKMREAPPIQEKEYSVKPFAPAPLPEWARTEEGILDKYEAFSAGKPPLFGFDSLFVSSKPSVIDRIAMTFKDDPWMPFVKTLVENKNVVRNSEIEGELQAKDFVNGETSPRQRTRIAHVMQKLGYEKKNWPFEGQLRKAWVRIGYGTPAQVAAREGAAQ